MPTLTALRQLTGSYNGLKRCIVAPGEAFSADDQTAESLESRGLAERYHEPQRVITFAELQAEEKAIGPSENKVQGPSENKAASDGPLQPLVDKLKADMQRYDRRARRGRSHR